MRLRRFDRSGMAMRAALLLSAPSAVAEDEDHAHSHIAKVGSIRIVHAWARAASAGDDTLVFMDIENQGEADRLMGGRTEVGRSVEIVGLTNEGGQIAMEPVGALDVPPGDFPLDPGGVGLAIRGLNAALEKGNDFELAVEFQKAGAVTLDVEIEAADATQHSHDGHEHQE